MSKSATDALPRRVWQALFDLDPIGPGQNRKPGAARADADDSRALFTLDPRTGRPMRSLADEWQRDPSNATFIVDRLEELGLASRQPVLHDKQVKLVVLTRGTVSVLRATWSDVQRRTIARYAWHRRTVEIVL